MNAPAARLGRRVLVLTGNVLGGQLLSIERIDGWPGHPEGIAGYELCPATQEQATAAGAAFAMTEATALAPDGPGWRVRAGAVSQREDRSRPCALRRAHGPRAGG